MTDMRRAWKCSDAQRAIACSTDPVWLRAQLGVEPVPSKAFAFIVLAIGALALMGIVVAVGSI